MLDPAKISQLYERIPVRLRLSLGHALLLAAILLGIGVGVYRFIEINVIEAMDATLLTSAKSIRDSGFSEDQSRLQIRNAPFWWSILDEFYDGRRMAIRSYAQMVDLSGNISAKTRNTTVRLPVTPHALARAEKGLETFESFPNQPELDPQLRQVTLPVMNFGRFTGELIQVGAPLDSSIRVLSNVKIILTLSLALALMISIIFGHYLTGLAFRPVGRITRTAAGLGVDDLGQRIPIPAAKDELRNLVVTFNELLDRLEDAFSRLRRFAGDVSHELRTPLAVLRGEADLALRRDRTNEAYKNALGVIAIEAKNMTKTVEDLLLLARAQGNSLDVREDQLLARAFLDLVIAEVDKAFEAKKVNLHVEVRENASLHICPGYLSLALKNLLLNALKHSPPCGTVHLSFSCDFGYGVFKVQDQGDGISKADIPYVFDPFYRADTARNRKVGGAGIGLSLAQAMVKLHRGTIDVESNPGFGATFTIKIPMEKGSEMEPRRSKLRFRGFGGGSDSLQVGRS